VKQANGCLNTHLVPALTALSENTYLSAIRAGMVSVVPLTIIGGLFMIVSHLPVAGWEARIAPYFQLLRVPVTATFGLLAVFACFAIGYDLGKQLKQEAVVSATMATLIFLLNSKEPGFRKVSRISLPTQVFGINEPIFFGFPIVLNPIFMIPYILNALVLTTGTYLLMHWNVIHKPFVNVPWTTPPIIGHYLVSGGDWKAAVWGAVSIAIAMTVYFPFAKVAERQRLKAEVAGKARE
jgi:cellobiose-specific phosphotransferase system component IIC